MKIEITDTPTTLDVKRCYLPIVITDACPVCGAEAERRVADDHLSYPKLNQPFEVWMHHDVETPTDEVEHGWKVRVVLRVTMEPAQ